MRHAERSAHVEKIKRRYLCQVRTIHPWNGNAPITEPPRARCVMYSRAAEEHRDSAADDHSTSNQELN